MAKNKKQKLLGGHPVVYATKRDGLSREKWDDLVYKHAAGGDEWPLKTKGAFFLVVQDNMDRHIATEVKVFSDEKIAFKYAKAASNGNVDHRVLKVVEATLIVATENEL
jgi:hypothetical protein